MMSYDSIGNPIGYYNGTQYTFAWENGRQLKSVDKVTVNPETETAATEHILDFEYDRDGVRTNKYVSGVANYTYKMENGRLVTMLCDDENGQRQFRFSYDDTGRPYGFTYSIRGSSGASQYYYITNLQGDVIGIMNSSRQVIAKYRYDAWGKLISMTDASGAALGENTIGARNPLRYRGYIYDSETGFYYLQTRYYDPVVHRFINEDVFISTGAGFIGYNMYAYCNNNPVNMVDSEGSRPDVCGDLRHETLEMRQMSFDCINSRKVTLTFSGANNTGSAKSYSISDAFGAGSSTYVTTVKKENAYIPDPLPITAKSGMKAVQTISKHGNYSKLFSAYATRDAEHPVRSSSAGLQINIFKFSFKISLGLDNIGISASITNGNKTSGIGVSANLSELKVGIHGYSSISWDNTTTTSYTDVDVNGWFVAAAAVAVTTGQCVSKPCYA